jgi:formylglycine-generating enzyme required for sulfatase activity
MDRKEITSGEQDIWRSICLSLEQVSLGSFIFIEADFPNPRESFRNNIEQYRLQRTVYFLNVTRDIPPLDPLFKNVPEWMKKREPSPQIIILDGFEELFINNMVARQWLETFNFSREALSAIPVIFVFLVPGFCMDLFRRYSPDVFSWRAFFYNLPKLAPQKIEKEIPLLDRIPRAFWDGVIEAAKTAGPLAAFGLGFFKSLQESCEKIRDEQRKEVARALHNARFEDIETQLKILGFEQRELGENLVGILQAFAELEELKKGETPKLNAILEAVQKQESIAYETRIAILSGIHEDLEKTLAPLEKKQDLTLIQLDVLLDELHAIPIKDKKRRFSDFEKAYIQAIKKEYGYLQILGIPSYAQDHPIDVAFISLALSHDSGGGWKVYSAEDILARNTFVIIRGPAGAGKTTLLQWEAVQCSPTPEPIKIGCGLTVGEHWKIGEKSPWSNTIPFLLKLRSLVKPNEEPPPFPPVSDWVKLALPHFSINPPDGWIDSVLEEGRALLLIDGLDEFPPSVRPDFWKEFGWWIRRYKKIRARVTSRPFPIDGERASQWAIPKDPSSESGDLIPCMDVQPLTSEKIHLLIDKWHEAAIAAEPTDNYRRERLRSKLLNYPEELKRKLSLPDFRGIRELATNPFLCAAICLINCFHREYLPQKRHLVYKMLIDALLNRRDIERRVRTDKRYDILDIQTLVLLHASLAWEMMNSGALESFERNSSKIKEMEQGVYLVEAERQDVLKWMEAAIQRIPGLRRIEGIDPTSLLEHLVVRCGLLREPTKNRIDFRHRALQEYLTATAAMQDARMNALIRRAGDDRWRNTIILAPGSYFAGFSSDRFIKGLIKFGESRECKNKKAAFSLAVACLETAETLEPDTEELVKSKLNEIVPPKTSEDAKALSAAGDAVVKNLPYDKFKAKPYAVVVACAETLSLIGSEKSLEELKKGYSEIENPQVILHLVNHPLMNPLEMRSIIRHSGTTDSLKIPEFVLSYIKDISPLSSIEDLISIDLGDCANIADIEPLGMIKRLSYLNLEGCDGIRDFHPLRNLVNLEIMKLGNLDRVEDLSPLSTLINLRDLDLSRCRNVTSLESLSCLINLKRLVLRGCEKIADISPLKELLDLEELDLSYCNNELDLYPLSKLPKLRILDLKGRNVSDTEIHIIERASKPVPGSDFIETESGLLLRMKWIQGGGFDRGSPDEEEGRFNDEGPVRKVNLNGFHISSTPITQSQYRSIMGNNPSNFKGDDHPVECVSWEDAMIFCRRLSQKTGRNYTLPTEAQWEYSCRSGTQTRFYFGEMADYLGYYAWYSENSEQKTHPVGLKRPNAWGLYDMHGNVWEWCLDHWHENYEGAPDDGSARISEEKDTPRVIRGGGWGGVAGVCRSAFRDVNSPGNRWGILGFRVCLQAGR